MARGDRRRSLKMKRKVSRNKKKAREQRARAASANK